MSTTPNTDSGQVQEARRTRSSSVRNPEDGNSLAAPVSRTRTSSAPRTRSAVRGREATRDSAPVPSTSTSRAASSSRNASTSRARRGVARGGASRTVPPSSTVPRPSEFVSREYHPQQSQPQDPLVSFTPQTHQQQQQDPLLSFTMQPLQQPQHPQDPFLPFMTQPFQHPQDPFFPFMPQPFQQELQPQHPLPSFDSIPSYPNAQNQQWEFDEDSDNEADNPDYWTREFGQPLSTSNDSGPSNIFMPPLYPPPNASSEDPHQSQPLSTSNDSGPSNMYMPPFYLPPNASSEVPRSSGNPTVAASVQQETYGLDVTTLQTLWQERMGAPLTTQGPVRDVLGVSRAQRNPTRTPTMYDLSRRRSPTRSVAMESALSDSSSARRSFADTSAVASSSMSQNSDRFITRPTSSGIDRQFRKVTRKSGTTKREPAISEDDKEIVEQACNYFIAAMCVRNCWPEKGKVTTTLAREALYQANSQARRTGRAPADETSAILRRIKHAGSLWRGRMKDKIIELLHEWNTRPSAIQIEAGNLTEVQIRAHVAQKVQDLLDRDTFCNLGKDANGHPALYTHPALHEVINQYFFDANGIATLVPGSFSGQFPAPALAFTRTMIRCVLRATVTGVHQSVSLGNREREDYKTDLMKLKCYLGEPDEFGHVDDYHKPIVRQLLADIIVRGQQIMAAPQVSHIGSVIHAYDHIDTHIPVSEADEDAPGDPEGSRH